MIGWSLYRCAQLHRKYRKYDLRWLLGNLTDQPIRSKHFQSDTRAVEQCQEVLFRKEEVPIALQLEVRVITGCVPYINATLILAMGEKDHS